MIAWLLLLVEGAVSIPVGGSVDLKLGFKPTITICDDTTIVKVEDAGEAIRLVGLKEGRTDCGFRKIAELPPVLYHIEVVAKRKK